MAVMSLIAAFLLEETTDDNIIRHFSANNLTAMDSINISLGIVAVAASSNGEPVRVEGYVQEVVSLYSDIEFLSHFRMQRSTFEQLCRDLALQFPSERSITLETKMLATLRLLGNQECYRSIVDRFGMSKGLWDYNKSAKHIKSPESRQQQHLVERGFRDRCGMSGVVGVIDDTHIAITVLQNTAHPLEHRSTFTNRKGFPSIQLQVVCGSQLKLLNTYTDLPGSVHDA